MGCLLEACKEQPQPRRIALTGLTGAGKTTILRRVRSGALPSSGAFAAEAAAAAERVSFAMLELGDGRTPLPALGGLLHGVGGVAFAVDCSAGPAEMRAAADTLHELLRLEELRGAALLVLANKQDLAEAHRAPELEELLRLGSLKRRKWHCQGCCGLSGVGVGEGLDWLIAAAFGSGVSKPQPARRPRPGLRTRSASAPAGPGRRGCRRPPPGAHCRQPDGTARRAARRAPAGPASGRAWGPNQARQGRGAAPCSGPRGNGVTM
eukprot:TRINITY_DN26103_c0_g1_i1.p2 TRINITY_DN26103_c0_g1~~TRINITY_DN26103_c0_g1_i1.p2  ORF type:complete len:265 (+),score=50.53 TRINITY_DN26103_c0_g1_i1:67-861(+)